VIFCLAGARDLVEQYLGVGGALEDVPGLFHLLADLGGVDEVAVVRHRDGAALGGDQHGLCVVQVAAAGG
jgi:hypothetical protein